MSEPARFLLATLCGLVLAAGVHISIVLGIPAYAERDAFSRLRSTMAAEHMELIAAPGGKTWLTRPDPAVAVAACAYDLDEGPVRISAQTGPLFQSLSFQARGGGVFFAVTDRAAVKGVLDIVVMTQQQLDEALAVEEDEEESKDVRIVSPKREGVVIVRVLAPFPSLRAQAEESAKSVTCTIEAEEEEEEAPQP